MKKLCDACRTVSESTVSMYPSHVVNPRDGTPQLWDTREQAICPDCRCAWQHEMRGKTVVLVGHRNHVA